MGVSCPCSSARLAKTEDFGTFGRVRVGEMQTDSAPDGAAVSARVDADGMLTQRVNASGFQKYLATWQGDARMLDEVGGDTV